MKNYILKVSIALIIFSSFSNCSNMFNDFNPVPPPVVYNFNPALEWHWNSSQINPDSVNVISSPVVADINKDNIPDIIFSTYADQEYRMNGTLRVISGNSGTEILTVTNQNISALTSIAVGDIDNDGQLEILL